MTRIEALIKSSYMWGFMYKHNMTNKSEVYKVLKLEPDQFNCSLCSHATVVYTECSKCALSGHWTTYSKTDNCLADGSPYTEWLCSVNEKTANRAAKRMFLLLGEALVREFNLCK